MANEIQLNGEWVVLPETVTTLSELMVQFNLSAVGIIAEVNGALFREEAFITTSVCGGDVVELIQFMGGGGGMSLQTLIINAYAEDIPNGDVTTDLTVDPAIYGQAIIITKEPGVFFGKAIVAECIAAVDPSLTTELWVNDGDVLERGMRLIRIQGRLASLLKLERVLLNFLQRLCGIASTTAAFVVALDNPSIHLLETRKTTPLLRDLEKQAVVAGGGHNHRINLSDMVLIKENHLIAMESAGVLHTLRDRLRAHRLADPNIKIEIEIETLGQIDTLPLELADVVMFDNFPPEMIAQGAQRMADRGITAQIEVSGNVTLDTIRLFRDLPIQRISVGALTHSVKSLDLSMRITS